VCRYVYVGGCQRIEAKHFVFQLCCCSCAVAAVLVHTKPCDLGSTCNQMSVYNKREIRRDAYMLARAGST